eukprot:SAG31_NODE_444_length_15625_cov_6.047469_2_plen_43_part_00
MGKFGHKMARLTNTDRQLYNSCGLPKFGTSELSTEATLALQP